MTTKISALSRWTCLLSATLCLGVTACDSDDDVVDIDALEAVDDQDASMRVVEYEVIAELVTEDGATLVFTREPVSEGSDEYLVGTKMIGPTDSVAYGQPIMNQELTPLEVFLAFAPEGTEPPEELQVIHQAMVAAADRETDDVRELLLPRAINTSAGHLYCDNYSNFTAGVDNTWKFVGNARQQVTDQSSGNHSVSRNGWHAAYGMACNRATTTDQKLISMCRRQPSDLFWSCESTTLNDGEYGWKTWSTVSSGGYFTSFNFQLNAMNLNGQTRTSFLGLVVVGFIT